VQVGKSELVLKKRRWIATPRSHVRHRKYDTPQQTDEAVKLRT
jgi:hypothetical protein